jgi:hypothetical protein
MVAALEKHLENRRLLYERDLARGVGGQVDGQAIQDMMDESVGV